MIHSIGHLLRQTREKRGLSIDEAAHATKLRHEQLTALEIGDYAAFPSNAYAKGFLKLYGRYLGIDVTSEANTLDTQSRLSVEDYQYLSVPNEPRPEPDRSLPDLSRRHKPSLKPLLASAAVAVVAFFGFSTYVNWQRITGDSTEKSTSAEPEKAEPVPAPEPPAVAAAAVVSPVSPVATMSTENIPVPVAEAPPATAAVIPGVPTAATVPTATTEPAPTVAVPGVMVADRNFLGEPPTTTTAPEPTGPFVPVPDPDRDSVAPMPVTMNEVEVSVSTRTWVTIRRDDADAAPLFEDYLYPGVRPLKLKGSRFIIEARDPGVVEIRKNGAPIAYQRPGVTVQ